MFHPTNETLLNGYKQYFCGTVQQQCTGENQQYDSFESCLEFVSGLNYGGFYWYDQGGISCRVLHLALQQMSPYAAATHCPHSGPTGGGKCIYHGADYYYSDKVLNFHTCRDTNF